MINYDTYKEIQKMIKAGVKFYKIYEMLKITKTQFVRYGQMSEDIFLKTLQSRIDYRFETYRDFIISILKVTPDINDTAVLYRVKEEFDDFDIAPKLQKIYEKVYLIRNERQMHLHSFNEGKRFEPDYVLFLIKKEYDYISKNNNDEYINFVKAGNVIKQFDQLQVFIEPKGDHLLKQDDWKEKFLMQLQDLNLRKIQVDNIEYGDYGVWGVHFYNERRNTKEKDFENDMKKLLYENYDDLTDNIVKAALNKKLAAHIDIGKLAEKLDDI